MVCRGRVRGIQPDGKAICEEDVDVPDGSVMCASHATGVIYYPGGVQLECHDGTKTRVIGQRGPVISLHQCDTGLIGLDPARCCRKVVEPFIGVTGIIALTALAIIAVLVGVIVMVLAIKKT